MKKIEQSKYTHRLIARFVIEADTPIAIGSGQKNIMTDALVACDANGLPYLPASTIAGVVRSILQVEKESDLWGYQSKTHGHGSEIIFSEGKILGANSNVIDGLRVRDIIKEDSLLKEYASLPIRQHVRIGHNGVTEDHGKFDEQVVFAGTRFCFEVEIVADENNANAMKDVVNAVNADNFRLGGGTRCGLGKFRVVYARHCVLDLRKKDHLDLYLGKSSNLDNDSWWESFGTASVQIAKTSDIINYTLCLTPRDFIFFGSGFGDSEGDADMTTVKERRVQWTDDGHGKMTEDLVLIPASSVKGALRHRVVFHYNKKKGIWAKPGMTADELKQFSHPQAVEELFGYEKEGDTRPGHVYFSDIIQGKAVPKLLNHVSIDRFTGGTIDGALFTEQVDYLPKGTNYEMTISLDSTFEDEDLKCAFERALDDICEGLLPLGGGVSRGNGIFTGTRNLK